MAARRDDGAGTARRGPLGRRARSVAGWAGRHRVSTVPTLAAMWDDAALAGVRLLILGGEACPEPLAWRLAAGRDVWNTYGPTEATVVSTAAKLRPGEPVTIGWPLAGWQVAVLGEGGAPVALGEPGELVVGGVGLGRYLDSGLDAERFAPLPALGWERAYRTGDIVRETIARSRVRRAARRPGEDRRAADRARGDRRAARRGARREGGAVRRPRECGPEQAAGRLHRR